MKDFFLNMTQNVRITLEGILFDQISKGTIPWHKRFDLGIPYSLMTGKHYDYKNRCLLSTHGGGYGTEMHYKQAKLDVKKIEQYEYCIHSCNVRPGMLHPKYDPSSNNKPSILHTKYYKVWSASVVDGYNHVNQNKSIDHKIPIHSISTKLKSVIDLPIDRTNLVLQMCYLSMAAEVDMMMDKSRYDKYVEELKEFYLQYADPDETVLTMALYESDKLYRKEVR